jgi:predicted HTH transcriptional regulator
MYSKKYKIVRLLNKDRAYSRQELQKLIPGSRCTVIRKINELVESNFLKKIGNSRSTRYIVAENKKDPLNPSSIKKPRSKK